MIARMLNRAVVSDQGVSHICQIVCSIVAALVMVLGFQRLAELEFTEAQLYSAMTETLLLTGLFIILGFFCRAWRRAVRQPFASSNAQ